LAGNRGGFEGTRGIDDLAILPDFKLVTLRFLTGNGDFGAATTDFHGDRIAVFVGRDETRKLKQEQLKAFRDLADRAVRA
jgi:hypothetical protein